MASNLKIVLFLSSVRPGRMADRVSKCVMAEMKKKNMTTVLFDPLKMPFEMVKTPIHFMPKPEDAPKWLKEANETLKTADGFIIASAEYNAVMPPALTNMLDHFPPSSYRNRPVVILSYSIGNTGGSRVQFLLRGLTVELGMLPVPTNVLIQNVGGSLNEEGVPSGGHTKDMLAQAVDELRWFGTAIKNQTAKEAPPPAKVFH